MREYLPLLTTALLAALAAAGCSELPHLDANQCGNHVLDPGEHCDGEANCQPAGSDGQCRYTCDPEVPAAGCPDGCDPLTDCLGCCPSGFGCGVDHLCRQAAGNYTLAVGASAAPTLGLELSDLDADGRSDVVRLSTDTTLVHFFGDDLAVANTTILWGAPSLPLPGDLTGDGLADLTQRMFLGGEDGGGLAVFRSQSDRSLLSTAYASISLKGSMHARFAVIDALPPAIPLELIAFRDRQLQGIQPGFQPVTLMQDGGGDAAALVGIAVGNFAEDPDISPCEEFAFAHEGATEVRVLQPCLADPTGAWLTSPAELTDTTEIALPAGLAISELPDTSPSAAVGGGQALFAVDWNGDGHLDLVIVAGAQDDPVMLIAYGGGNGSFHSTLPLPVSPEPYDNRAEVLALVLEDECEDDRGFPLAFADFNGDDQLDIVLTNMLLMSTTGNAHWAQACNRRWTAAVAADFNGNGTLDLVTTRQGAPSLDFFDGTGQGMFTHSVLPSQRPVKQLATGDFDGDLLADVVFTQRTADEDSATDEIFVAFGRPAGSPELPEKVGEVDDIEQIQTGPIRGSDAAWESLILSRLSEDEEPEDPLRAAIVVGNGHRGLHAPFVLRQMVPGASMTEPIWVTRGTFSGEEQAMAAMTKDDVRGGGHVRVWLISPTGNTQADMTASVAAESAATGADPTGIECDGCVPAALDLGDDGIDELLTFDRSYVSVYEIVDDGSGFESTSSHSTQILFGADDDVGGEARDHRARPVVADIDHDGRNDVSLMASSDVVILWNDGAAALAERWASEDEAVVTRIESPPNGGVRDFALLQADGDMELELVVVGRMQSKLLQLVGSHAFEALSEVEPLKNWPSDKDFVRGGEVIAAGDLDGDGVDDLIIGDFTSFTVLQGQAVLP